MAPTKDIPNNTFYKQRQHRIDSLNREESEAKDFVKRLNREKKQRQKTLWSQLIKREITVAKDVGPLPETVV